MIEVITGAVSSGKSKRLIEYYNQLKDCGVMVFSSKFSLAHGEKVTSRYGTSIKAIPINSLFDIPHHIGNKTVNYILIDEFQFLQMTTKDMLTFFKEYYCKYNFYIFGLNTDYKREPFSLIANIMTIADKVTILKQICPICKEEMSKYSLRLINNKPAILEDDADLIILDGSSKDDYNISYQGICDKCWNEIYNKEIGL